MSSWFEEVMTLSNTQCIEEQDLYPYPGYALDDGKSSSFPDDYNEQYVTN